MDGAHVEPHLQRGELDRLARAALQQLPPPGLGSPEDLDWGLGGNETWAWKSFLRGLHPAFMDPWRPRPEPSPRVAAWMTVANGIA